MGLAIRDERCEQERANVQGVAADKTKAVKKEQRL